MRLTLTALKGLATFLGMISLTTPTHWVTQQGRERKLSFHTKTLIWESGELSTLALKDSWSAYLVHCSFAWGGPLWCPVLRGPLSWGECSWHIFLRGHSGVCTPGRILLWSVPLSRIGGLLENPTAKNQGGMKRGLFIGMPHLQCPCCAVSWPLMT